MRATAFSDFLWGIKFCSIKLNLYFTEDDYRPQSWEGAIPAFDKPCIGMLNITLQLAESNNSFAVKGKFGML